jgi:Rod binding domain-containing protein
MRVNADLSSQTVAGDGKQQNAKLVDAAEQFEAMLMQEMLKPMRSSEGSWDEEKKDDSSSDTISSFGTEAVAKAISKGGGLGIAKQVVRQVTQEHEKGAKK